MSKLTWDEQGTRLYETGVQNGALYVMGSNGTYSKGVAWNGLTTVTESPSGAEASPIYADNIKYLNLMSAEEFGATIEAYTYPDEFAVCDGSAEIKPGVMIGQQKRKPFGLSYKTVLGNDVDGADYGYKLHLIYGATAAPSEKAYASVNDSPDAITFSWELTTTPVAVTGFKPTASLIIDSTKVDSTNLKAIEAILYGDESNEPRLPLPDEVASLISSETPDNPDDTEPVDTNPLQLTYSDPIDNQIDFSRYRDITLTFNKAITASDIKITDPQDLLINVTKNWESTQRTLTMSTSGLPSNTSLKIVIASVEDADGDTITNKVINFSTEA